MTLQSMPAERLDLPARLTGDPHRPQYHYLPPANWMNDPNGLIEWNGAYHLFYQYTPGSALSGIKYWGHAVSADLVHWHDLPFALAPTPGPDAGGCWSGCAVDDGGVPTLVYTGVSPQVVCLATGSPDLVRWSKHSANPVIAGPPPELAAAMGGDCRDPYLWRQDGQWQMVIAGKLAGQGGVALRYRSADLLHWDYQGVLLAGDARQETPLWPGEIWECPNFFPLGDQHILLVSVPARISGPLYVIYYAGRYDGETFTPVVERVLVHGYGFYAPQVMRLSDGRAVMWGWVIEDRPEVLGEAAGWQGVMSAPIALTWGPEGALHLAPAAELQALRGQHWHFDPLTLEPGTPNPLAGLAGNCLELELTLQLEPSAEFTLALCVAPDSAEQTLLTYDRAAGVLRMEPCHADHAVQTAPLVLDASGRMRLHILLDRSLLEVFANDATCLVARHYPARADSQGLALTVRRGWVVVEALDVWALAAIW
jgi:beta-fructofuranosidase